MAARPEKCKPHALVATTRRRQSLFTALATSIGRQAGQRTLNDMCCIVTDHDDDGMARCALLGAMSFFSAACAIQPQSTVSPAHEQLRPLQPMQGPTNRGGETSVARAIARLFRPDAARHEDQPLQVQLQRLLVRREILLKDLAPREAGALVVLLLHGLDRGHWDEAGR